MLCESCHQREATCHVTSIHGDLMQKRDLCQECFEALSPGGGTLAAAASRCEYCGGQAFSEGTDVLALLTGVEQTRFMCMPCNAEFQRYTLQDLAGLPEGLSHQKQLSALRSLRDRRDAHMRQWASERRPA
jgi:protein-arginine kinase activator protein McsA